MLQCRSNWSVPLASPEGVRRIEAALVEAGTSVQALMETAAERCFQILMRAASQNDLKARPWLVLAGPGHNGADGWALARKAAESGLRIEVVSLTSPRKPLTESQRAFALSQGVSERATLPPQGEWEHYAFVVDALFGCGQTRALDAEAAEVVSMLDGLQGQTGWQHFKRPRVVSLDVPSGLDARTGVPFGTAVKADMTLVLGAFKTGLLCDRALAYTGRLHFVPLGFLRGDPDEHDARAVRVCPLPRHIARKQDQEHKLSRGEILVSAGSLRYPGAGILALEAVHTLRTGYVRLVTKAPELRAHVLHERPETILHDPDLDLAPSSTFSRVKVAVIGCGQEAPMQGEVARVSSALPADATVVIDGAWCTPDVVTSLVHRFAQVVVTPHWGEFARLAPEPSAAYAEGRDSKATVASRAAQALGCYVVLKGPYTAVAAPSGRVFQSTRTASQLARAGSGDVLAGVIGGVLLQALHAGLPLHEAIAGAVEVHVRAAPPQREVGAGSARAHLANIEAWFFRGANTPPAAHTGLVAETPKSNPLRR